MSSLVSDAVAGLGRGEGPADERPLTDQERQLVARLLSDPFAFPQTFKTWLVSFLESSDLTLPISSIQGLGATLGIGGGGNTSFIQGLLPAGTILGWGSGRTPAGCLRCDGAAYSRSAYARLFTEIGSSWGAGDGVTTFNVPDLRRRVPVGVGASGFPLAQNDGLAESGRSIDHHHYFTDSKSFGVGGSTDTGGGHSHSVSVIQANYTQIREGTQGSMRDSAVQLVSSLGTSGAGDHSHGFSGSGSVAIAGNTTGGAAQDHPAFVVIQFIITT